MSAVLFSQQTSSLCCWRSVAPPPHMSSLFAGTKHAAHQQEDQTGDELQRNPCGRHHEGQAIERCDLCVWTGLSSLLEDIALHLHRLHPQHEQQQHEEDQAGWGGDQTQMQRAAVSNTTGMQLLPAERCLNLLSLWQQCGRATPAVM